MKTIGDRIRERRLELGLTQTDLAIRMGYKTKSTICEVERPGSNITSERLMKFAEALNTTPFYLLGLKEDEYDIISAEENTIIELYRKSDQQTKEMVKRILAYKEGIK